MFISAYIFVAVPQYRIAAMFYIFFCSTYTDVHNVASYDFQSLLNTTLATLFALFFYLVMVKIIDVDMDLRLKKTAARLGLRRRMRELRSGRYLPAGMILEYLAYVDSHDDLDLDVQKLEFASVFSQASKDIEEMTGAKVERKVLAAESLKITEDEFDAAKAKVDFLVEGVGEAQLPIDGMIPNVSAIREIGYFGVRAKIDAEQLGKPMIFGASGLAAINTENGSDIFWLLRRIEVQSESLLNYLYNPFRG